MTYISEPRYARPTFLIRVRARRHIRDAFTRRNERLDRHHEGMFNANRHEGCAALLSKNSYSSLVHSLKLSVDDVLTCVACLRRCAGTEMFVPRMINVVSMLIANSHEVCGPHRAFALVTSLCLGILHMSSAACRKKPFDALTNIELLKRSDSLANDVVPKKWISDLNRELAVALLHIDEQQVEVWKSALLNMQTVHHVESSAHMHSNASNASRIGVEPWGFSQDLCFAFSEEDHLIKMCVVDSSTVGLHLKSSSVVSDGIWLTFRSEEHVL